MGRSTDWTGSNFAAWTLSSGSWTDVTESGTFFVAPAEVISSNAGYAGATADNDSNPIRLHHADASNWQPHNPEVRVKSTQTSNQNIQETGLFLKASSATNSADYYLLRFTGTGKTGTYGSLEISKRVSSTYTTLVADTDITSGILMALGTWIAFRAIERASDVLLQGKIWQDGNAEPAWPDVPATGSVTANPADGVVQVLDTSSLWNAAGSVGIWTKAYGGKTISKVADRGTVNNGTGQSSTTCSMAAGASITVGNTLIARVAMDNGGTSGVGCTLTVSDPRGNTWTVTQQVNRTAGSAANDGVNIGVAYCNVANAYSNGDNITFNYSPNVNAKAIEIEEWTPTIAKNGTNATGSGGSTSPTATISTPQDGELVYGALGIETSSAGGDSFTQDSDTTNGSWSSLTVAQGSAGTATNSVATKGGYKVVNANGNQTYNPTITNRDWAEALIRFTATPAAHIGYQWSFDDFNAGEVVKGTVAAAVTDTVAVNGTRTVLGTLPVPITDLVTITGRPVRFGTLPVVGGGLVTIAGTPTVLGTLPVLGGGVVTVNGTPTVLGTLPIVGGSVVSINGHPVKLGTLAIAGGGLVTVTGHRVGLGTASFVDGGHIDVTGVPIVVGTISLSGGGQVLITGTIITPGAGLLAIHGGGALTIAGHREGFGVIDFDLADTIQVAGSRVVVGNTTIFGGGLVLVDGFGYKAGTVQITGGGAVDIDAFREVVGDLLIAGGGQVRLGAVTIRILTQSKRIRVFSDNQFDATDVLQDDTMTVNPMGDHTILVRPTE